MAEFVYLKTYCYSNLENIKVLDLKNTRIILKDDSFVNFNFTDISSDLYFYFKLSNKNIDIIGLENYRISVIMNKKFYKKSLIKCKCFKIICRQLDIMSSLGYSQYASNNRDNRYEYTLIKSNITEYLMYKNDLKNINTFIGYYNYNLKHQYMHRYVELKLRSKDK
jgi:hypothetical protein